MGRTWTREVRGHGAEVVEVNEEAISEVVEVRRTEGNMG